MSATAHSPTTTTSTATNTANMKSQAPFSLHHLRPEGIHSPLSESNSGASSPLYSGCGPHDDSTAIGNETLFRADHDPQLMSTPVKGVEADQEKEEEATMPQQSTPINNTEQQQQQPTQVDEPDTESCSTAKKDGDTGGKRKRDSLESIDCSMVMPEGRVTRSVKRLKRFNSTAKGLRRNLSFNAMKSPFTSLLRRGRSSVLDTSTHSTTAVQENEEDNDELTVPDCAAQEPMAPTNQSPTFKTPIALPPINHHHHNNNGAAAAAMAAAAEWRAMANASIGGESLYLPEIQEEEGQEPEGKSAPADPLVEYLLTHSLTLFV